MDGSDSIAYSAQLRTNPKPVKESKIDTTLQTGEKISACLFNPRYKDIPFGRCEVVLFPLWKSGYKLSYLVKF